MSSNRRDMVLNSIEIGWTQNPRVQQMQLMVNYILRTQVARNCYKIFWELHHIWWLLSSILEIMIFLYFFGIFIRNYFLLPSTFNLKLCLILTVMGISWPRNYIVTLIPCLSYLLASPIPCSQLGFTAISLTAVTVTALASHSIYSP